MTYLRTTLTAVVALLIAMLGPGLFWAFGGITSAKATGLAVVAGGLLESFFTPRFWILFISFFALFRYCSRLDSKPLRITFFWVPAAAISTLGIAIVALYTYLWVHFSKV